MSHPSLTSLFLFSPSSRVLTFLFTSDVSGLAGFARLCAGDQYEVRQEPPLLFYKYLFLHNPLVYGWALLGSDALWPAALEATRSSGSQQQADMGQ